MTEEPPGGRTTPSTTTRRTTTTDDFPAYNTPPQIAQEFPVYDTPPQVAQEFPIFNTPPQIAQELPAYITPPQIAQEFPIFNTPPLIAEEFPFIDAPPQIAQEFPFVNTPPQIAQEFPYFNTALPTSTTPRYIEDTYYPAAVTPAPKSDEEFPNSSNFPAVVDRFPTKPSLCDRTLSLSEPVRISSPNFPSEYLDNESCNYFLQVTLNNICFVRINFISFVLRR